MPIADLFNPPARLDIPAVNRARRWWQHLTPNRQDRVALLAPIAAVVLFMAAIVAALGYLQIEEMDREQQAVQRDVEYTQQRLRLRLLERQEQLSRIGRALSSREINAEGFRARVAALRRAAAPPLAPLARMPRVARKAAEQVVGQSHLRGRGARLQVAQGLRRALRYASRQLRRRSGQRRHRRPRGRHWPAKHAARSERRRR